MRECVNVCPNELVQAGLKDRIMGAAVFNRQLNCG
jgi:hypothetical protein